MYTSLSLKKPNLLLLDEPTNHLDLEMRHALNVALQSYQGSLLVISHDRHLLETVTDELWLVADGELTQYDGDLEHSAKSLLNYRVKRVTDSNSNAKKQTAEMGSTGLINSSETLIDKKNRITGGTKSNVNKNENENKNTTGEDAYPRALGTPRIES